MHVVTLHCLSVTVLLKFDCLTRATIFSVITVSLFFSKYLESFESSNSLAFH